MQSASEAAKLFTVCCLFYGDYPQLAERLVRSLQREPWRGKFPVRVGLNAVCAQTRALVAELAPEVLVEGAAPYYKYPVMRKLLYCPEITTPYVMWFDDDSCFAPHAPPDIFARVAQALQQYHIVGLRAFCRLRGKQAWRISQEPWFTGKRMYPGQAVLFCCGGWWAARYEMLRKHDWPIPSLEHRGGDVLLGALCYQQGYKQGNFTQGLWINADDTGQSNSSQRRGQDPIPWGVN